MMKARISHICYNTDRATNLCFKQQRIGLLEDRTYEKETLYMDKHGRYFLHKMTYSNIEKDEMIIPFSVGDAESFINECFEIYLENDRLYRESRNAG